jgi:hypothetical protein
LLNKYFEFTIYIPSESEYSKLGFWEVGIMKGYAVKGKDWLDKVIEANGLD